MRAVLPKSSWRGSVVLASLLCAVILVQAVAVVAAAATPSTAAAAAKPPGTAIASAHALTTDAGLEIIRAGGNAFDAAVAVTARARIGGRLMSIVACHRAASDSPAWC